jgi:hypothetical protein
MIADTCNSDGRTVHKKINKRQKRRRKFLPTCCWNTSSAIHLIKVVGI